MKKILALFMALLLIFSLAACTDSGDDNNDNLKANFFLMYNGEKIEIGADAKTLMPKLGAYTSEDGEACGTGEKDVIYSLSGIEIETHVSGESEKVRQIKLLDDSHTTFEGVTIGSTRDDVIATYGKDYTEGSGGAIRYVGEDTAIEFHFGMAGNVSNIYIKRK